MYYLVPLNSIPFNFVCLDSLRMLAVLLGLGHSKLCSLHLNDIKEMQAASKRQYFRLLYSWAAAVAQWRKCQFDA